MPRPKILPTLALVLALAAEPAFAADEQHEQHHPQSGSAAATARQGMGPGGMMGGGMMGQGGMPMGGMPMMGMMQGHIEGRIAFLKTELKITDAQLPLWNTVAEAIRANGKAGMGMMSTDSKLPDRLAAREKAATARLEALRKFKAAADPLYATLADDQKKTADDLLMSPVGMGMM